MTVSVKKNQKECVCVRDRKENGKKKTERGREKRKTTITSRIF